MKLTIIFHYLLLIGTLAMPLGLVLLSVLQMRLTRRLGENKFNFIKLIGSPEVDLTRDEQALRKTGISLLLAGTALVLFSGTIVALVG